MAKAISEEQKAEQRALGRRLASCRELAKLKQDAVANELGVTKAAVSAWEGGRNMPNPLMLKKLAKLYSVSVDGMLWDNSLTMDAMRVAAQFDALSESQKTTLTAVLMAFVHEGVPDARVEAAYADAQRRERELRPTPTNHPARRASDRQLIPSPILHMHRRHDDPVQGDREAGQ
jgi:transcriptional regulator with XRE-family HTH domain